MIDGKLKCPFCGNEDAEIGFDHLRTFVFCHGCDATGPAVMGRGVEEGKEAVRLWDKRVRD